MKVIGDGLDAVLVGGSGALSGRGRDAEEQRIHVVSAAIVLAGRMLFAQRAPGSAFAWTWCSPGGKVEPGERPLDALAREVREEVGLTLGVGELATAVALFDVHMDPPLVAKPLRVTCYRIQFGGNCDEVCPGDKIIGVGWLSATEISCAILTPADNAHRALLSDTTFNSQP